MNANGVPYRKVRIDRGIKARSDSIYIVSSYRELGYTLLPRVLPVIALLSLPLVLGEGYWGRVLVLTCIYALLALSWDFLQSVGMISLGQAFFFGAGGYIAGALNYYFGLPPIITIPIAALGGGLVCAGLLAPVVRLRGIYFSMITLVYPLLLSTIIEATHVLGGSHGLPGLTTFHSPYLAMYIVVVILIICLFGFRRIMNEDYGIVLKGIKDNEQSIMSGGINVYWYKVQAIFIAAFVGALAGAIATHYWGFVGMSAFALEFSIFPIAGALVGGIGTFAGATLGTFILAPLSELLRDFAGLRIVLYSLILAGAVVALPEGVFHYLQRKYAQFERRVKF
jgi:branched-chain amino acid transport system permease protein